jgi:hypothetical protein
MGDEAVLVVNADACALASVQLSNVKTSPSYVTELAASIDIVDQLLADFKKWQAGIAASLAEQQVV